MASGQNPVNSGEVCTGEVLAGVRVSAQARCAAGEVVAGVRVSVQVCECRVCSGCERRRRVNGAQAEGKWREQCPLCAARASA